MSRAAFLLGTTSVNNCLVLLFAATSLTSDRVMSPNGSFSTVVNTIVLEWGQGVVLSWGGGWWGNSKLCAFLKRERNSTYLCGLHRRRGGCVFKIWMSRRNSKLCAFLKRERNSTYLCGLHRRRGGCVFKIWMSRRSYPRGQRKTSLFSFYATTAIGQFLPVILAFPR